MHFREPGLDHKEDLESGSRGAVLGGVTAVFEMPNTKPNTDSAEALADKLARADGRMWCDHAFYIGATAENADRLSPFDPPCSTFNVGVIRGGTAHNIIAGGKGPVARGRVRTSNTTNGNRLGRGRHGV